MLTLGPVLARGATATVYECANDPATVIKHVQRADAPTTVCEIALLCALAHPNVMRVCGIGALDPRGSISLQMPRYDQTLAEAPAFTREHAASLLRGLAYIHARGVIHCDLKPANIFVSANNECVIADFGLARLSHSARALHQVQSPAYRAPEVAIGVALTSAIDLWSVGVIIAELAYKYMLDINTDDGTVYARAYYGIPGDSGRAANIRTIASTTQTVRAAVFAGAGANTGDPVLEQLTRACLRFDPSTRITAVSALVLLGDTTVSTTPHPRPLLPARDDAAIVHILARADVTAAAISPDTLAAGVAAVSKCISGRIPDVTARELMGAFRVIRATRGQMLL